jgi:hypothetical protein
MERHKGAKRNGIDRCGHRDHRLQADLQQSNWRQRCGRRHRSTDRGYPVGNKPHAFFYRVSDARRTRNKSHAVLDRS